MRFECRECGQHLEVETMYAGQEVECPGCGAELVIGQESLGIGQGDERPTSNIEHGTSNEEPDDLRTIVQSLWEPTIRDGDLPEMTLKGETMRRGGASQDESISSVIKVRPKEIAHKGATPEVPEYEILRLLGEGGMGMVYQARQTAIDRSIAIKMVKPEAAKDKDECHQFLAEAVATGDLDHPNIVPIYDLGMNDAGALFYAMKEVKGTSWKDVIYEKSLNDNLDILMRTADAVAFAHNRGVIHRDLKPENVMLGDFGEVLLMDWGLAAAIREDAKADPLDPEHAIGGTPTYMAPEMAIGDASKIGTRSDVYLLGAILYEIITGGRPHTGTDVMDCLANAAENEIVDTAEEGELVAIALKAMATEPEDRYESVKSFQAAVREYQQHEESIALAARARDGLVTAKAKKHYQGFARCVVQLEEAISLWADNQPAVEALSAGKRDYAECALKKGDLDLAASILDGGDKAHRALSKQIRAAKKERDARQRRTKVMKVVSLVSAAVVFVVVAAALIVVRGAQKSETQQRKAAEDALANYEAEQARRRAESKKAAPVFLEMADRAAGEHDLDTALLAATTAVEGDPDLLSARRYRAGVYICRKEFEAAQQDLEDCLETAPSDVAIEQLLALCARAMEAYTPQVQAGFYEDFFRRSPGLAVHVAPSADEKIKLYRTRIAKVWPGSDSKLTRGPSGKWALDLSRRKDISNLAPIRGMPLSSLNLGFTGTTDLSPLEGMPLTVLDLGANRVRDLGPLKGMPLTSLTLCKTVSDLGPLKGMPLRYLDLWEASVSDLSPLRGMSLRHLVVQKSPVTDLSPLAGMPLSELRLGGTRVTNLSPLRGAPLRCLRLEQTPVSDLSPLRGMPLTDLSLWDTRVSDLSQLTGMPLSKLNADGTKVADLSPLEGMPLTYLSILRTQVVDFSPLKGMSLKVLKFKPWGDKHGLEVIRNMDSLESVFVQNPSKFHAHISYERTFAEFRKMYDAGEFGKK